MKKLFQIAALAFLQLVYSCEKTKTAPQPQQIKDVEENYGPYGKFSSWKSVGGDTLFDENLTLTYFAVEENSPCHTYYYQQNISFWNCYEYTMKVSGCIIASDTLVCTDIDTQKKAIFKREK